MKEFLKRLAVVVFAIPLSVWLIYQGGLPLIVVIITLSSITIWEYYKLLEKKSAEPLITLGVIAHIFILSGMYYSTVSGIYEVSFVTIAFFTLLILSFGIWKKSESSLLSSSATLSGILYITMSFGFLIYLREIEHQGMFFYLFKSTKINAGAGLVMTIFISIWICDTVAYLSGMAFGRHKLIPSVSPKKTWEGAIGGFIGAVLAFYFSAIWLAPGFNVFHSIICGIIVGTIGQIGDLAESKLKRDAGVKDSSNIIPGHGGLLDRFDSILFVFPAICCYLLIVWIIWK